MNRLAIIIPAYRAGFLAETLESIASQSCKDFSVYIGDDASGDDLKSIVDRFAGRMDIHYTRFEQNIGGKDLCAQWSRCLALSSGEEWIWLFSDDDLMAPGCVSAFVASADKSGADLFHFNVDIIDAEGQVTGECSFPEILSAEEFTRERFRGKLRSYAVEYIFRRSSFIAAGGFVPFDLAWNSDDATWATLAGTEGIRTIDGPRVSWRRSGSNITSSSDAAVLKRKLNADIEYIGWLRTHGRRFQASKMWFATALYYGKDVLSREDLRTYSSKFGRAYGCPGWEIGLLLKLKTLKRKLL